MAEIVLGIDTRETHRLNHFANYQGKILFMLLIVTFIRRYIFFLLYITSLNFS